MNRLAALLHCPRPCIPLIIFRWILLLGVWLTIIPALAHQSGGSLSPIVALIYATIYLGLWTARLPTFAQRHPGSWTVLWLDLILSYASIWLAGKSGDAFTPFVYGALILPGAIWGWTGAGLAISMYVTATILQRAFYLPLGELWDINLVLNYLGACTAAVIWPLAVTLQQRWPIRQLRAVPMLPVGQHETDPATEVLEPADPGFTPRLLPDLSTGRRAHESPQPATLERRATRLHAAVRQATAEAQQQGLEVALVIEGREIQLPPGYIALVVKAIEVALDNVRQHAGTTNVRVQVINTPTLLQLSVRDYGAGLLDGTADLPGFHHLKLLRYRLSELGGTLTIIEPDEDGVLFVMSLPLQP